MDRYEATASKQLAEEFYADLQAAFQKAANHPELYYARDRGSQAGSTPTVPISLLISDYRERHNPHFGSAP
jgi:hypothetical protein